MKITDPFRRNSTCMTLPSSEAVALSVKLPGTPATLPAAGGVSATVGGALGGVVETVTLSSPRIWSGEVCVALSSTQRKSSVPPLARAPLKVTSVLGVVDTPAVLGTVVIVGLSAVTLVHVAPLSRL